ncbi:gamma-glutamyltransferase [Echria macrotheca]|uniref:Glutathione hydrolase n=1 Tax=Echria macrotheca TaxID=438768 RepID=A0AAJ0F4A1_9PEZI|nr:gamma-glutamyltransferase [Echria macrotheca]
MVRRDTPNSPRTLCANANKVLKRRNCEALMISLFALLSLFLLCRTALGLDGQQSSPGWLTPGQGRRGAVSSLDSRCTAVGIEILSSGGNAADAAVGVQFCLGVVGLHLTGIGGGGFMLVRSDNGTYEFIDFRETAPAASFEAMFDGNTNASIFGGSASGIPGEVQGLHQLHTKYGRLPWAKLVAPAVKLAESGFVIGKDLGYYMDLLNKDDVFLSPAWAPDFAPRGIRLRAGDLMTRKRYARVLQAIAERGPEAFYTGPVAKSTVKALADADGIMTLEDLRQYKALSRPPRSITYKNFRITSCGAPTSGIVVLKILKTILGYDGVGDPGSINLTTHRLDEAIRFAYGARTKLGDPDFIKGAEDYQLSMLSDETAAETRSKILDNQTQPVEAYNPDGIESLETPGTSHVSVADASGLAVSLTSTVNLLFGSLLMDRETGILMNNEMNDFSLPNSTNAFGYIPSSSNYIKPGKRPFSSISPVIVEHLSNGTLYLVTGAAGGSRIITATTQSLWNVLDRSMNLHQAVVEPRFHDQLVPNKMVFENAFDDSRIAFLKSRGHDIGVLEHGSDLQMVRHLYDGIFEAASETRQQDSAGMVA